MTTKREIRAKMVKIKRRLLRGGTPDTDNHSSRMAFGKLVPSVRKTGPHKKPVTLVPLPWKDKP